MILHAKHGMTLENVSISYQICSINHGFCHISQLLVLLAKAMEQAVSSPDAAYVFQNYLSWVVDTSANIDDLQKRRCSISDDNVSEVISFALLAGLLTMRKPIQAVDLPILSEKYYVTLTDRLVGLLQFHPHTVSSINQMLLARTLLLVAQASRNSASTQHLIRTRAQTAFRSLLKEDLRFSFWSHDLKVSAIYKLC